ncbi:hypothetical protein TIFTF001_019782 [Ficus carica]|uniref:Uncharacterized protein n=1 Tax=Ficus carica TaxID=3494 RepID=A0AA88AQX0_FICCA|nr:hypothetical protein TIFTF001_019782 [Ficus carica]
MPEIDRRQTKRHISGLRLGHLGLARSSSDHNKAGQLRSRRRPSTELTVKLRSNDLDTGTMTSGRDGFDHGIATAPIVRHRGSSELCRGIFYLARRRRL